jgi:hypothetical protein
MDPVSGTPVMDNLPLQTPHSLLDHSTELQQLRAQDSQRLGRMVGLRGLAEQFRRDPSGSDQSDYGREYLGTGGGQNHDIRLPYIMATVMKHTHRAGSKVPDVRIERADQSVTEQWRQYALERYLAVCWGNSDGPVQLKDACWDGAMVGSYAFEVEYDIRRQIGCFYSRDPAGIVVVPDPVTIWPYARVYRSWTTPIAALVASYRGRNVNPFNDEYGPVSVEHLVPDEGGTDNARCTIHEVSTADYKLRWCGGVKLLEYDHELGICPWVVGANIGPNRQIWGYGDVELMADAAIYFQSLMSKQADVVGFASRGAYMDTGTGQASAKVVDILKKGGVLPGREGAEVKPIETAAQPAFIDEHLDMAHRSMLEVGFTTTASWASSDGAAATSGNEGGMRLQPTVELARLKQVNLAWALARVNEIILRIAEKKILPEDGLAYRGNLPLPNGRTQPFKLKTGGVPDDTLPEQFRDIADTSLPTAIDGNYETSIVFTDRLDMYDPQYALSELSKFTQGAQSLRTTLENLGCQDPDNEIGQIVKEAEQNPWMRQGMIALIKQQLDAQNQGGGAMPPGPDAAMPGGVGPETGLDAMGAAFSNGGSATDGLSRSVNGSDKTGRPPNGVPGVPGGAY